MVPFMMTSSSLHGEWVFVWPGTSAGGSSEDHRLRAPVALDAPLPAGHYAIVHLCTCCTRPPEHRQLSRSTPVPASPFRPHLRSSPAVCVSPPNSIRGRV